MYITASDLTANGITGESAYLDSLVARVEALFNTLIGDDAWVLLQDRTEELSNINSQDCFLLRYAEPATLKTINGVAIDSADYKIIGQKLYLKNTVSSLTDFPYLCTIVYEAWYDPIPEDIKQVCLSLAAYINNTKTSQGISSFRQDLLTVQYGAKEVQDYLESMGQTQIINKYKYFYAYSL